MPDNRRYLLRVEGMNLVNVIDDTDQLSVRRGGGLMILNAAMEFLGSLDKNLRERLSEIATGASIGLFEFEAKDDDDAESVRKAVETHFRDGHLVYEKTSGKAGKLPLRHGTFVVDVAPVADASRVQQAEQLAVAKNRWRQLQEPTLSLDGIWDSADGPCELDRTRVANATCDLPEKPRTPVSRTVRDRRDYGRGARQSFYRNEIGEIAEPLQFTDDLHQLSGRSSADEVVVPVDEHIVDKLAVFYVDGNGFGEIGRSVFATGGSEGYRNWSNELRKHHRVLLKGLIQLASEPADPAWRNDQAIRLETLLWGGDEILWVMPAWKGWEVAKWFFSQAHRVLERDLTYGCGLVFCHAKAPVKNITALAHRLGDAAKAARGDRNVHRLAYEVLEAFDDISGDLDVHRRRFLPPGHDVKELVFDPGRLGDCWSILQQVIAEADFPMRQLYMLTEAWRRPKDAENAEYKRHEKRLRRACEESDINVVKLLEAFGDPVAWLHLLQMLPYLPSSVF